MNPTVLSMLTAQLLAVVVGVVLLVLWVRVRYAPAWGSLGWGALTFPLSQLLRIPLLLAAAALLNPVAANWDPDLLFWVNFAVLTLTSGLFEEGARYVVLRWAAKGVRAWKEGLFYGVGHGGIEAVLIVGGASISNIVLLASADTVLAQLGQMSPEQAAAVQAQIDAVQAITWSAVGMSIWERATAIILHIGLSLLVLLGVVRREFRLVLAAMLVHALFNAVALLALRYANVLTAEIALTVAALLPLYLIWRLRPVLGEPASSTEQ